MCPRRDNGGQVVLPGAVGINVGLHLLAIGASLGDECNRFGHLAPQTVVGNFQMNNFHRQVSPVPNFDRLPDGIEHSDALRAHVRGVDATVARGNLAHRHQRVSVNPGARGAAQGTGQAERALLHCLLHQFAHLIQFRRCGRASPGPMHVRPDLARPDVAADIG